MVNAGLISEFIRTHHHFRTSTRSGSPRRYSASGGSTPGSWSSSCGSGTGGSGGARSTAATSSTSTTGNWREIQIQTPAPVTRWPRRRPTTRRTRGGGRRRRPARGSEGEEGSANSGTDLVEVPPAFSSNPVPRILKDDNGNKLGEVISELATRCQ